MNGNPQHALGERLRQLLYRRLLELEAKLLSTDGEISREEAEAIEQLSSLADIACAAKPRARRRWPAVGALLCTVVVVSALLFGRLGETEVELEADVSELGFELSRQQLLSGSTELGELGVSGLTRIELPSMPAAGGANFLSPRSSQLLIRPGPVPGERPSGSINLGDLLLPKDAVVSLRSGPVPGRYRLTLQRASAPMRVTVYGAVDLIGHPMQFHVPAAFVLHPDSKGVDLDLTLPEKVRMLFVPQLFIRDLKFLRHEVFTEGGLSVVRSVSTVLTGVLYFEEIDGRKRLLRPGDPIRFDWSQGIVRTAQVDDARIRVQFRGLVRGMKTGAVESQTDLMPTYLEWLQARHGLALLWAATVYAFSLVVGFLRWWGVQL